MIPSLVGVLVLCLVYWFPIRRWCRQWGTTKPERTRLMRGDAEVEAPTYTATLVLRVPGSRERGKHPA